MSKPAPILLPKKAILQSLGINNKKDCGCSKKPKILSTKAGYKK